MCRKVVDDGGVIKNIRGVITFIPTQNVKMGTNCKINSSAFRGVFLFLILIRIEGIQVRFIL